MVLYEENKDKVLVYNFSPRKDDILDYKKAYLERTPNSKLFYLLDRCEVDWYNIIKDDACKLEYYYSNTPFLDYIHQNYLFNVGVNCTKNDYLTNNGYLIGPNSNYFVSHNAIYDSNFNIVVLKLADRLKKLWELEHERFPSTYYSEVMKLFDFYQSNEFNKKDIDELIICGLINQSHLDYHKEETKVLKRIYNIK